MKKRCEWAGESNKQMILYHDKEWGRPVKNDQRLFELLCLEGAQAGLSWATILAKREKYREVFHDFDIQKCAKMTDRYLNQALQNQGIIRNKLKVFSVKTNALAALKLREDGISLRDFFWNFVDNEPIIKRPRSLKEAPASTEISLEISKKLKPLGFKFIGPTIIYAFMQASGMVNDHTQDCFLCPE